MEEDDICKNLKQMLKMIQKHKEQYGKENYEEIRTGDSSQRDEVPEKSDPCPVTTVSYTHLTLPTIYSV